MTTTRAQYRTHIGRALGRAYYASSATTGTSTSSEIVDTKRTEPPAFWDGASILVGTEETVVNGSDPTGRLFLNTALVAGAPATATAYQLLKGFTWADMDEAIDWTFADCYPHAYDPIDDKTTFSEVTGTTLYALTEAWRDITEVRREIENSSPTRYEDLARNLYTLRQDAAGLQFEALYTPKSSLHLWFVGRAIPTLGSTASATSLLPWQLVVPGSLAWLYEKGANPDETSLAQRFAQEAQKQLALFEAAKVRYGMPRARRKAWTPGIDIRNDGSTVPGLVGR